MALKPISPSAPPVEASFEVVFKTVKSIIEAGPDKQAEFLRNASEANATVTIKPDHVNLVKEFLFNEELHVTSAHARSVVESDPPCPAGT
jgi:hypothetical protein